MSEGQCPWDGYPPGTLKFCEEHVCGWIVAPAETWSNLPYLLIGVWLLIRARPENTLQRVLGAIAVVVGALSGLYHASHLWWTETADLGSMAFLSSLLLGHALVRVGWLGPSRFWAFYALISGFSWVALFFLEGPARLWVFTAVVLLYLQLEGFLWIRVRRLQGQVLYGSLYLSLGLFSVSYFFWLLDFQRWACDPKSHLLQGHAAWHVINAFCFLTLNDYLGQFPVPWLEQKRLDRYA